MLICADRVTGSTAGVGHLTAYYYRSHHRGPAAAVGKRCV